MTAHSGHVWQYLSQGSHPLLLHCGRDPSWDTDFLTDLLRLKVALQLSLTNRVCELWKRDMSFSFPVLLPAFWEVGMMAGATAARLDPDMTFRMKALCSRATRWEAVALTLWCTIHGLEFQQRRNEQSVDATGFHCSCFLLCFDLFCHLS